MNRNLVKVGLVFPFLVVSICTTNLYPQNGGPRPPFEPVVAFGFECQTTVFPRRRLARVIRRAVAQVKYEGSSGHGERAVGYDLDGDGVKEYFVALRDMGIGDNYLWGVFSVKPIKFLGLIPAEHVYINRRAKGSWPVLIAHWHESISESSVSTFSFRKGSYVKERSSQIARVNKETETPYTARTTELYICDRTDYYNAVPSGDGPIKPRMKPKAKPNRE